MLREMELSSERSLTKPLRVPRIRARELLSVRRAAACLAGLVVLSAVVRFLLALWMPAPWIFADELSYSELGKSFAATGHFSIRDVPGLTVGPLYPLLIAPAYAAFTKLPDAYVLIKAINAVVMSLAAVPTYFLARRLLTRSWSLVAAGLAIAVPSMAYTGMVMTENLFYPLFLVTVLALIRTVERPSAVNQLSVLALVALACLTRAQGVALVPALLTAIALDAWRERTVSQKLAQFLPTWLALGAGLVGLVALQVGRGRSLFAIFGNAAGVWHAHYPITAISRWLIYHAAEIDLYSGVLPFAAFLVLVTIVFRRAADRTLWIFATISTAVVVWLILLAAAFAAGVSEFDPHSLPHTVDRYTFYVTPLLVIALLAWVTERIPRSTFSAIAAAVVAGLLPFVLPLGSLIRNHAVADSLGLLLWARSEAGVIVPVPHALARVGLASLVLAALFFLLRPPRLPRLVALLVLVYFTAAFSAAQLRMHAVSAGVSTAVGQKPDWIDQALGSDQDAAVIWSGRADPHVVWENEFFNRSVGRVYYLRKPSWPGIPEQKLSVRRSDGVLVDAAGKPLKARFVLVDPWVVLRGPVVARDRASGMRLYRLNGQIARISAQ
jgi:hypothetical protein